MKRELGDHIGKKKGWVWYELAEVAILVIKKVFSKKKQDGQNIDKQNL